MIAGASLDLLGGGRERVSQEVGVTRRELARHGESAELAALGPLHITIGAWDGTGDTFVVAGWDVLHDVVQLREASS